ncbi:MAG: HAD-IIIC family phosphatase, partial [Bryobacteraceae bacterium]
MKKDSTATPFRFAISATFTADPLRPYIEFWGRQLKSEFEVRFAPFNQMLQTLLDRAGEFVNNIHGVNIVLARLQDFAPEGSTDSVLAKNAAHILAEMRSAPEGLSVPLIFCLCPSTDEEPKDLVSLIAATLSESPGVQFLHYEQIAQLYPVAQVHDLEGDRLGKIPYSELYYCALATGLVRQAHALSMHPYKVVALDCDNTLWAGICGEDGAEGVTLDPARRFLQEFMAEQREAGMLLALASKNNEEDVKETFRVHAEMPLQLSHFAARRLNWEPKSSNLLQLSEELSLSLDSFIFVDDSHKECEELQQAIPEVLTLALPEVTAEVPSFLQHIWAFDHPSVTEEDLTRNAYYAQEQEFGSEVRRASSMADFMASLDLHVTIEAMFPGKLARVSQLTQRTNQFNFTTVRRSEAELRALTREGYEAFTVDVTDRFGSYGLVGAVIVQTQKDHLAVETFVLSCRALGRGVEHRIVSFLGDLAVARGIPNIRLRFEPTPKNLPAKHFYESIAGRDTGAEVTMSAVEAAGFHWKPDRNATPVIPKSARLRQPPFAFVRLCANCAHPGYSASSCKCAAGRSITEPKLGSYDGSGGEARENLGLPAAAEYDLASRQLLRFGWALAVGRASTAANSRNLRRRTFDRRCVFGNANALRSSGA